MSPSVASSKENDDEDARGGEGLIGAFAFLDMVPKGRNEPDSIMQWVRLHDQYDTAKAKDCCH